MASPHSFEVESSDMRTLVVDDSRTARRVLVRILASLGHDDPVEAGDGAEALDVLGKDAEFDLVLADVHMPRLDGFGLIKAIRASEKTAHLPILIISSESDPEKIMEAVQLGASGYVTKPFRPAVIRARIKEVLEKKPEGAVVAAPPEEAPADGPRDESPSSLEGDLENLSIVDLLQFLAVQRRSGRLEVEADTLSARIRIREGECRSCRAIPKSGGELLGPAGLERVALESSGRFRFMAGDAGEEDLDARIDVPTLPLIFELARKRDDARGG